MKQEAFRLAPKARLAAAIMAMPDAAGMEQGQVGNRTYKYVPLSEVMRLIKPVLAEWGLVITQSWDWREREGKSWVSVTTSILDTMLGDCVETSTVGLPVDAKAGFTLPQAVGATITYARRYAIMAMLGLAFDEDTDAAGQEEHGLPKDVGQTKRGQPLKVEEWVEKIRGAKSLMELKTVFVSAFTAASSDPDAQKRLLEEKDKKKLELEKGEQKAEVKPADRVIEKRKESKEAENDLY